MLQFYKHFVRPKLLWVELGATMKRTPRSALRNERGGIGKRVLVTFLSITLVIAMVPTATLGEETAAASTDAVASPQAEQPAPEGTATEESAPTSPSPEEVDVSFAHDNAIIICQGTAIPDASSQLAVIGGAALTFSAVAHDGYSLGSVTATISGSTITLSPDASGTYVVPADMVSEDLQIFVTTEKKETTSDTLLVTLDEVETPASGLSLAASEVTAVNHTVPFVNADGSTVVTQTVADGTSAVTPNDPDYMDYSFIGWSLDGTNVIDVAVYHITSDTTFIALYKAPVRHTIIINYVFSDGTSVAYQPYEASVADGASFAATIPSPDISGFHLVDSNQTTITLDYASVTTDETVNVMYSGDASYYTVQHSFEQLDGSYAVDDSLTTTDNVGNAGAQTEATAVAVTGYTAEAINQATIVPATTPGADGCTKVTVTYDLDSHLVSYDTQGGFVRLPCTIPLHAGHCPSQRPHARGIRL